MSNFENHADFKRVMDFIIEIDKLKNIFRRTNVIGQERFENDAEHSWHISVMAYSLHPFFDNREEIDVARAVKMLLLHDMVELYAGDTYCYDSKAGEDKAERELAAADKIFGMLPCELSDDFMSLWLEFDEEETPDAVFASIMDKMQPLLLNYENNGDAWLKNGITKSQVLARMDIVLKKSPDILSSHIGGIIQSATDKEYLTDK